MKKKETRYFITLHKNGKKTKTFIQHDVYMTLKEIKKPIHYIDGVKFGFNASCSFKCHECGRYHALVLYDERKQYGTLRIIVSSEKGKR